MRTKSSRSNIPGSQNIEYSQFKIGQVSEKTGIAIDTLRFYEKSGLLDRPVRTPSGYRIYDHSVFDRLAFVRKAQSLGLTLDEIRQVISEKRAGHSPCRHVRSLVRERLNEIDRRLIQMKRDRDDLEATLKEWDKADEVEGHICGLIEGKMTDPEFNPILQSLERANFHDRATTKKKKPRTLKA